MHSPAEHVSRRITPLLRELALHKLLEKGLSQNRLARITGLSQPMVWKIARRDPQELVEKLQEQGLNPHDIEAMAMLLAHEIETRGPPGVAYRLVLFEHSLIARGVFCEAYSRENPRLRDPCSLTESYRPPRDPLLEELTLWFRELSRVPRLHEALPQVGSNLVLAEEGALNHMQTVAFPGRIIRVGSRVKAIGDPAYGASLHTARVLLAVKRLDPGKRAAFVLAYREQVEERLVEGGHIVCRAEEYFNEWDLLEAVEKEARGRGTCDVVLALPALGVEPVVYLFASSLDEMLVLVGDAVG